MTTLRFLERAIWDDNKGEIRDGELRYLMIRADALMGIFRLLPNEVRSQALTAFTRSIHQHGGNSAQKYRAMGAQQSAQLLKVIADTAPQLGWGRWHFEQAENELRLSVRNSPFAGGYGTSEQPVCAAVVGMLQAVSEMVLGAVASAEEIHCAAQSGECCHFIARLHDDTEIAE